MRLKPHEAQSYRKKALWVSWVSIAVTIILAIAAFSECLSQEVMPGLTKTFSFFQARKRPGRVLPGPGRV